MKTISHKKLSWIFIEEPKGEDISFIQQEYKLDPIIIEELTDKTYRPEYIKNKNYHLIIVHFPVFDENGRFDKTGELDILFNDKTVTTICSHANSPFTSLFYKCRKNVDGCKKYFDKGPMFFMMTVIRHLLEEYYPILDKISEDIDKVESKLFKEKEIKILREISYLQRDVIDIRRIIKPQLGVFTAIAKDDLVKNNTTLTLYVQNIISKNIAVWNNLENILETVESLYSTSNIMLSYKTSRAMKLLTVFSIVIMPAMLISSSFGMNLKLPLSNFWEAFVLMSTITLATAVFVYLVLRNSRK